MKAKALKKIALSPLFSRAYRTVIDEGNEITPIAVQRAERARLYKAISRGMRARKLKKQQKTIRDLHLPVAGLTAIGLTSYALNS